MWACQMCVLKTVLYHLEVAVKIVDGLLLLATSKESEILMDVKKEIQGIIDKYRDHL